MADTVINGTDIVVFIGGNVVAHGTSHTLSMKMKTRETSNKDTYVWDTMAPGRLNVTATCNALVVYANFSTMANAVLARIPVVVSFGQRTGATLTDGELIGGSLDTTEFYAQGNFIITGLDINAGDETNASYTATFDHSSGFQLSTDTTLRVGMMHSDCTTHSGTEGFAAAFPIGGTPPYTYQWSGGSSATTQYVTSAVAGTYTCTVTDDDAATAANTCIITEPAGGS